VSHPHSGGNGFCSWHRVIMCSGLFASANLHSLHEKRSPYPTACTHKSNQFIFCRQKIDTCPEIRKNRFFFLSMVVYKVTIEPYRVSRVITNSYFEIKAGNTKHFTYLYPLSHKMKWRSVSWRPSTTFFSPSLFCSVHAATENKCRSFFHCPHASIRPSRRCWLWESSSSTAGV
jgi:hypothetical protein